MRACVLTLSLLAVAGGAGAEHDQERSAWFYRREVQVAGEGDASRAPLASLGLPPEVEAHAAPDLRDLRLLDAAGHEVAFVVDRRSGRLLESRWEGRLSDRRSDRKQRSQWQVDLGGVRSFDALELDVRDQGFAKRLAIEVSEDGDAWRVAAQDTGVFDQEWAQGRVRHTRLELPAQSARYVRLTADDTRSKPITLLGVTASSLQSQASDAWSRPAALRRLESPAGHSLYAIDLPVGLPLSRLELDADDAVFARRVLVREQREQSGRPEEQVLADARLYRVRLAEPALAGACLRLELARPATGSLTLEIEDADSPPLHGIRATASGLVARLVFPKVAGRFTLYYGNLTTRGPIYDLETLRGRLAWAHDLAEATLGPEIANPQFRKPIPLPQTAARGASLEPDRWRFIRRVGVGGSEDLWSLALSARDTGLLRPDLGDLRIVDEQGRQLPYILETAVAEDQVDLGVTRLEAPTPGRSLSRYRLAVPERPPAEGAPALESLAITLEEGFFDRPARVLAISDGRRAERVLFAGRFVRREPVSAPLVVPLDGVRRAGLLLEIEEGDNQPLTLEAARGIVRVPRVVFKAEPGSYRLLLGNRAAPAPRYDLASLRQEVLAYSAEPVAAGGVEANPSYRRRVEDYVAEAPPTLVLWASLVAAVVGLLGVTARILRQPAS